MMPEGTWTPADWLSPSPSPSCSSPTPSAPLSWWVKQEGRCLHRPAAKWFVQFMKNMKLCNLFDSCYLKICSLRGEVRPQIALFDKTNRGRKAEFNNDPKNCSAWLRRGYRDSVITDWILSISAPYPLWPSRKKADLCSEYTGWLMRLFPRCCWHQNKNSVLVKGPYTEIGKKVCKSC